MGTRAFLGLGGNLGDRLATLQRAVDMLAATEGIRVVACSRLYETDPVGGVDQPDFLNAALELDADLDARTLLSRCLAIEAELGRVRDVRWGPRTIDIDLLLYDDERIDDPPDIVVPHPRLHERAFALIPLLELIRDPVLSGGRHASEATPAGEVRVFGPPLALVR